jgi:thiol:disulfide interchange protein DsbC
MLRYVAVLTLILCTLLPCARAANSANAANAEPPATDPRAALLKLLPAGSKLEDLRPSPIAGIYEYVQGAEISYLTADGKYFIDGNLYDMKSRDNLTETLRTHARVALINSVPESEMLIFSPANPKYTITVFTDVDCAYCRKLHSQMAELNRHTRSVHVLSAHRTRNRELEEG